MVQHCHHKELHLRGTLMAPSLTVSRASDSLKAGDLTAKAWAATLLTQRFSLFMITTSITHPVF